MNEIQVSDFINQLPFFASLPDVVQQLLLRTILIFLVLFAIWFARNLVTAIVMVPIRRIATRTDGELDDQLLNAIQRPVRIAVLGIALALISALLSFGVELDSFTDTLSRSLILAAVIVFIYNFIDIIAENATNLRKITGLSIQDRLLPFMRTVTKMFILVIGTLTIINEFGFDVTGLIASFGVIGLAFSLAAQDTAANVFGFTAIVSDNPFEVGDYIVAGGFAGTVERVGVRSTRVRKLDQSLVTVPNNSLTNAAVTNWSRLYKRRMDFYIGVTYSTNSAQMRELLERLRAMLKARETIDPESVIVHFVEFGNSALQIRIIAYVLIADWALFTAETELINLEIMDIVAELGLSMAFPSTSLYVEQLPRVMTRNVPPTQTNMPPIPEPIQPEPEGTGLAEATYQANESASNEGGDDAGDGR